MIYRSTLMALAIVITVTGMALGGGGGSCCGLGPDYGPGSNTVASPYLSSGGACCGGGAVPRYNPTLNQPRELPQASCCPPAPSPRVRQISAPKGPTRNPFQLVAYELPRPAMAPQVKPATTGLASAQVLPPCCQEPQGGQGGLVKPVIPEAKQSVMASALPKSAPRAQMAALSNRQTVSTNEPSTSATLLKWPPRWAQPALKPGRISTNVPKTTTSSALPPCCVNSGQPW
ncbi:MAG: hypothetical protein AB1473_08905 [Thermodesulfobacteriota bacterium]